MALETAASIPDGEKGTYEGLPTCLEPHCSEYHKIQDPSVLQSPTVERGDGSQPNIGFFDLPIEIRLQIYETVVKVNPVVPRHLALGYPDYYPKPCVFEPVVRTTAKVPTEGTSDGEDDEWTWADYGDLGLGSTTRLRDEGIGEREKTKSVSGPAPAAPPQRPPPAAAPLRQPTEGLHPRRTAPDLSTIIQRSTLHSLLRERIRLCDVVLDGNFLGAGVPRRPEGVAVGSHDLCPAGDSAAGY